ITYDNLSPEYIALAIPNLLDDHMNQQALIDGADSLGYSQEQANNMASGILDDQIQGLEKAMRSKQIELDNLTKFGFDESGAEQLGKEVEVIQNRIEELNQRKKSGADFGSIARIKSLSDLTQKVTQLVARENPSLAITK